jgi:4-carboxymuconolactone decarboxylase
MDEHGMMRTGQGGAERMPPLAETAMTDAQQRAAEALRSGPRGGVMGPFIALLRSPELMDRLQRVGDYLRYGSSLETRAREFAMLIVSREWTQQFEWAVHVPLASKAGVAAETIAALAAGRRPDVMTDDDAIVFDFCTELLRTKGVSDATYRRAVARFGEGGVMDLIGVAGYFTTVSMVMNVARTPTPYGSEVPPLARFP